MRKSGPSGALSVFDIVRGHGGDLDQRDNVVDRIEGLNGRVRHRSGLRGFGWRAGEGAQGEITLLIAKKVIKFDEMACPAPDVGDGSAGVRAQVAQGVILAIPRLLPSLSASL